MKDDLDQLWALIVRNDLKAFEQLYRKAYSSLVHYALTVTFNHSLAEEAVQDIFVRLWQKRSDLFITGSFTSYLFRSVHNQALNLVKQQSTKKELANKPCSEEMWQFIENNYELDETTLGQIYMEEMERIIRAAITSLPEKCQKVFLMSRYAHMENEEIADTLHLSEHTVKAHIYRALQRISEVIKENL